MSLGELLDLVERTLGCDAADAFRVAKEIHVDGREEYSEDVIRYAAVKLGVEAHVAGDEPVQAPPSPMPEVTMDPAEVLREVYLACPRCVPADADGKVHMPEIGRAPQEEQHAIPAEILDGLPEHVRLLLMEIDVFNGEVTAVFYDKANGVDRKMPPIDLTRFNSAEQLNEALDVLLRRLPRIIAADWN